jgi:hypothetical protein
MINLDHSRELLTLLRQENIRTPENTSGDECRRVEEKIGLLRQILLSEAKSNPAPGLTRCAALTLLKVAACQDLTQRFALEYFLRFRSAPVSLVFAADENDLSKNHCFAIVGQSTFNEGLIVSGGKIVEKKFYIPVSDFLNRQQKDSVVADPLLDFTETAQGACTPLLNYCSRHHITHIVGIAPYSERIVGVADQIKANAVGLAVKYATYGVRAVLQKFKLNPDELRSVAVKEQALRRAAMAGTTEDLFVLLSTGINIDAQDEKPIKRNTALHLALVNQQYDNAEYLMNRGARIDIPNADGVTAQDLIEQLSPGPHQDKLSSLI